MSFPPVYHYKQVGRRFFCWLLVVLCSCSAMGQNNSADTVVTTLDTVIGPSVVEDGTYEEDGEEEREKDELVPDTPSLRLVTDSVVHRLQREKDFAYANDPAYWKRESIQKEDQHRKTAGDYIDDFASNRIVHIIFYILLAVIFLFVIYRVIRDNQLFRAGRRKTDTETEVADIALDEDALDHRVRQAIADKDYRLGTRFLYLKSLRSLDKKGWIRYHAEGTNNEYLHQVRQHGAANEFGFLTYIYDYVWYGEFVLTETQFNQVHQHFNNFHNSIRS